MGSKVATIVIDASDLDRVATFWASVLGWECRRDADGDVVVADPAQRSGFNLLMIKVPETKTVKNRVHIDLDPTGTDQAEELARLLDLGATRVDIDQGDRSWIVLADPEGNEFCLLARPPDVGEALGTSD
ncbi:MAG TPA: VOC family protein [Acidimicrobiales bacterium]|nr:VOC family protein [Acidimicrobiales bacterium]